jgi:subtilisin family serine protease
MFSATYGGRRGTTFTLVESDRLLAVRTRSRNALEVAKLSGKARRALGPFETVAAFRSAGVEVLRARAPRDARSLRDRARRVLKGEDDVRFAGRVLCGPRSGAPVVYTENLFVKFDDDVAASRCRNALRRHGLGIKREIEWARNAFFVGAPEGVGTRVFAVANRLLRQRDVEYSHPELVRQIRYRAAFPQQWHLRRTTVNGRVIDAHASVEAAWALSEGAGTLIAVIDEGIDVDHEELRSAGKIVAPRDATLATSNPRPGRGENHGTACAGVACANGAIGASGVAPRAGLMPIRLASGLGSMQEADAFVWAARHGADVISCSWGPVDGDWWDPSDPHHSDVVLLPDSTRLAIEWAVRNGRSGKGCVIVWAAGNGNESVDNDGYASFEKVMAVAACSDRGKRSAYSDFGRAVWCAFPSDDGDPSLTPGIWTTDRSGPAGYNPGQTSRGDAAGNYTNSFGGTSSATPGVAGVCALILARNPGLRWDEVRDVVRRSCDRIDPAGGRYDASGRSRLYGWGRVNARRAVELAVAPAPTNVVVRSLRRRVAIPDLGTARLSLDVPDTKPLAAVRVTVDIEHTYIGDLVVRLRPPAATGVGSIVLHSRSGGGTNDLHRTYDAVSTPALLALTGKSPAGRWVLRVDDREAADTGRILGLSLELRL